jgi:diguanylate cyclase (GGDEF)-like protein/PAS domain S-box-containing protein
MSDTSEARPRRAADGLRGPDAGTGLRGPNAETGLRGPNAETGLRGPNAQTGADSEPVVSPRQLRALRMIYDASPIGAAAWSIDGQLLHANPVFGDLVGRDPADLVGEAFASFIDPVDEPDIVRAVEDLWIGERNFFECEMRCRDAAGGELWLQAHLHPVYGEDRRPEYLVSQLFSFVGRKVAPAGRAGPTGTGDAASPEVTAPSAGDESPVLHWYLGDGFDPRPADARAAEFLGLEPGRPAADVADALFASIHGDDRAAFDAEWWERWGAREPFAATARSRRSDGEWRWLLHRARPWFAPDGRFGGYAGASVDVTEDELARARVDAELELFRGIIEAGPLPVARTDATGSVIYASARWESLLDDPATRLGGFGWQALLVPENTEQLARLAREAVRTRQPFSLRVRVRDTLALDAPPDHPVYRFWGDLRAAPVFGADGRLDGFVAVLADISATVAATELAERLAEVLAAGTDYVVVERAGALSYINRAAQDELGVALSDEAGPGPFLMDILDADSYEYFHQTVRAVLAESRVWTGELAMTHVSGHLVPVSVLALAHTDADEIDSVTVVARDISDLKETDSSMNTLAKHDVLTGLPNRATLYERVDQALTRRKRSGQKVALLFLDLDRFKPINDELGHQVGDAVLEILADRMHEVVRETDVTARIGGDEFAVLVEGYESHDLLRRVAERLIAAVSEPIDVDGTTVAVGVSIGIVAADEALTDPDELLARADDAMYEAKATGRGRYVFASPPEDDDPGDGTASDTDGEGGDETGIADH